MIRLPKWLLVVLALALVVAWTTPAVAAEPAKGKLKNVSADKNEFTLTDANNKDWTFQLAEGARIFTADKEGKLSDLKTGDNVSLIYDKKGDRMMATAVLLNAGATRDSDVAVGTVKSLTADKDQIVVTDPAGKDWTFHTSAGSRIRVNDKDSKLNDLKAGDHVALIYDRKGDQLMVRAIESNRK
jgi:Cu/Ag efflux protein CusF